jgi:hypothetical protein
LVVSALAVDSCTSPSRETVIDLLSPVNAGRDPRAADGAAPLEVRLTSRERGARLLLAAASFFFIAIAGHRISRSPDLRRLGAMLLCAPFLAALVALWLAAAPAALWMSGLLLGFTLSVAAALAYPLLQGPSPRRQRARDVRHARRREPIALDAPRRRAN